MAAVAENFMCCGTTGKAMCCAVVLAFVLMWVLPLELAAQCGYVTSIPWVREAGRFIGQGKPDEAAKLCRTHLKADDPRFRVTARTCLAAIALQESEKMTLIKNDVGGGGLVPGYFGPGVDEAVNHLSEAIATTPQTPCLHQDRLEALIKARRYDDALRALEASIKTYKGEDPVDILLPPGSRLFNLRLLRAALDYFRVLDKHYPNDYRINANIGAVLTMLKQDEEALKYMGKAVKLNPDDQINVWNLARLYDFTGKLPLADKTYQRALTLEQDTAKKKRLTCVYADFLEKRLKDKARACLLQKANCQDKTKHTACKG